MPRTIDFKRKGEKIKEQIDELIDELKNAKAAPAPTKTVARLADVDLEKEDLKTLQQYQVKIARLVLKRSK